MQLFAISYLAINDSSTTHGVLVVLHHTLEMAELAARTILATQSNLFGYAIHIISLQITDAHIIEAYKGLNHGPQS